MARMKVDEGANLNDKIDLLLRKYHLNDHRHKMIAQGARNEKIRQRMM